ncbi:MAG: hypothetical protein RMJ51_02015 [Candidatus Calescibacterium sp.]|nr:hypothetical protein [Candidatus Calescibacterium sp.]MCX7971896.1 hypothetical protein [bacterium]MDW8195005.1 hypothetical protein [Candidatus Calescibacterium sp.]
MFASREEINNKLKEYKEQLENGNLDYNNINEILNFLCKYGYLAELRDSIILYINKFIEDKPSIAVIEYQKALSIFPEDDEIFEKFINFLNTINLSQIERSIYIKTYIKVLAAIGKFGKAINIITDIINSNPDDIDNIILAANIYETEGHIDKAVSFYLQAIEKIPNIDEKIKLREQISVIDPANRDNILELVELYAYKKEFELASKVLRSLLRYNQNDPEVLYKIAEIDNLKGNYKGATIAIKKAIEIDPLNPKYRFLLGLIHFQSANKVEAEKILDQVIPELKEKNLIKELKEAIQTLVIIKESYKEKYNEILQFIQQEEQKIETSTIQTQETKQKTIEEHLNIQEERIEEKIYEKQLQESSKQPKSKSETYQEIPDKQKEEIKSTRLENRETLPPTVKKSTGVFIRKDTQEETSKKTLLTRKENILIKESTLGTRQQPLLKKEILQPKTPEKPTLIKQDKPLLTKNISEKQILEKVEFTTSKPTKENQEISEKQQEEIKSTVILTKESIFKEIEEKEKTIEKTHQEENYIEVTIDTQSNIEEIKNIELEMYENTLLHILSNFNSIETVITSSIQLINNISQITANKFRLLIWIYRLLVIANAYNLSLIRQKLIEAVKRLGYEKFLEYISIPTSQKQDPLSALIEEISLVKDYETLKYSVKEIVRYTVNNNYFNNFIRIYKILTEKYPEKVEDIDRIYIDVLNEEKNPDFVYIFLNISQMNNLELINLDNIELILNKPDYISIFEKMTTKNKSSLVIKSIIEERIDIAEKLIKKTQDLLNLPLEMYNSFQKKININPSTIEDINVRIILLPFSNQDTYYEYMKALDNPKLNKDLFVISYFLASNYPCLIFIKFEDIKDNLISTIHKLVNLPLSKHKSDLLQILSLISNNEDQNKINDYIDNLLEEHQDSNIQFMLSLVQCWYNKKVNLELTEKIIEKLKLIVDEIKEKELIEFYNYITNNG